MDYFDIKSQNFLQGILVFDCPSLLQDRMWRKNRVPDYGNSGCNGTDINRNFPYHWGEGSNTFISSTPPNIILAVTCPKDIQSLLYPN